MLAVVDVEVFVSHHQAYVTSGAVDHDPGDIHGFFAGQSNGICGAAVAGTMLLMTAAHTGMEPFRVSVTDDEPAIGGDWEDVVEVSFRPVTDRIALAGLMSDTALDVKLERRDYRVRYSVRGADAAYDGVNGMGTSLALDGYLLEFWPAHPAPDAVLRRTSSRVEEMHAMWTNPPPPARSTSSGGNAIPIGVPIRQVRPTGDIASRAAMISSSSVTPDGEVTTITITAGEPSAEEREATDAALRQHARAVRGRSPEEVREAAEENLRKAAARIRPIR